MEVQTEMQEVKRRRRRRERASQVGSIWEGMGEGLFRRELSVFGGEGEGGRCLGDYVSPK